MITHQMDDPPFIRIESFEHDFGVSFRRTEDGLVEVRMDDPEGGASMVISAAEAQAVGAILASGTRRPSCRKATGAAGPERA